MAKLTLSDLANLNNQTTTVGTINTNNASIEAALENTLSRDGSSPNEMEADLDMNSNQIINLPGPTQNHEAANKEYVDNEIDAALNAYVGPNDIVASAFAQTYLDETTASDTRNVILPSPTNEYHLQGDGTNSDWEGFTNAGSGAVTRGWQTKIREGLQFSVKDYGAVGDGVTDDLAAIQATIAAVPNSGGVVYFPPGTYRISSTLTICDGTPTTRASKQNISLIGASFSGSYDRTEINDAGSELVRGPSIIKFDGTDGTTNVVHTGGPGTIHMSNLVIDANAKGLIGLEVAHNWNSTFQNITIVNWKTYGLYVRSYGDLPIADNVVIGCMDNTFDHIRVAKAATLTNHSALLLGQAVNDATYGFPQLDVARCVFNKCTFTCRNDVTCSSITLRYCDLNVFNDCFLYAEFTSGSSPTVSAPIRVLTSDIVAPASNSFPSGNIFNNCPAVGAATTVMSSNWYSSPTNNGNIWFLPHSDEVGGSPAWPVNPRYGGIFGFAHSGHWLAPQIGVRLGNLIDGVTRSVLHRQMTRQSFVSTTAENTLFSRQIPAYLMQNYLCTTYGEHAKDRQLKVRLVCRYLNNTGGSETLTLRGKYGSHTFMSAPIALATGTEARTIIIEASLTARANSASQQWADWEIKIAAPNGVNASPALIAAHYIGQAADIAQNSETPLTLSFTAQHTTSSANVFITIDTATLEIL